MKNKSEKVGRGNKWTDKITLGRRGEGGRREEEGKAEDEKYRERGGGGGEGGREARRNCCVNLHPPDHWHIRTQPGGTTWLASLAGREE